MNELRLLPVGDAAILAEFGQGIDPQTQARVAALEQAIAKLPHPAVVEWVPTYRSLLVYYDPLQVDYQGMADWLSEQAASGGEVANLLRRRVSLPVLYGGEMGQDLDRVAKHCGLSTEDVIRLHAASDYLVYMLGFMPGFPYLGGLDERLTTPRLSTPRTAVPAGSVGIADRQTGVYPLASPGGWQLIGRTPVRLYDPARAEPILLAAGDLLRFCPITTEEYSDIAERVAAGEYQLCVEEGVEDGQR